MRASRPIIRTRGGTRHAAAGGDDRDPRVEAYRGPDRRACRARTAALPISPPVVAVVALAVAWSIVAGLVATGSATATELAERLARVDVAASALAILAGTGYAVRWKIDGYAPAWWLGVVLLVVATPGIVGSGASPTAHALRIGCDVVALAAVTRALRSPDVDTSLRPVRSVLATTGAVLVAFAASRAAFPGAAPDRFVHAVLAAGFAAFALVAAHEHRRRSDKPWSALVPLLAGLAAADAMAALVAPGHPLHDSAAAAVRLAAMSMPTVAALADLQAAAAVQREVAYREHLQREAAERHRRVVEARFAEKLHEVRSTVVALQGGVRRLAPDPDADAARSPSGAAADAALAAALGREIERLRSLVDDERVTSRRCRVREALEPMLTVGKAGGWPVSWDLPAELEVAAEPADLAQVVHGLLTNATRYAPGSPIDVAARRDDGFVIIRVEDRGPGVARGERDLIFERASRGSQSSEQPGYGLGLYIARRLARGRDGDLWVEQRAGGGASFVLALPAPPGLPTPAADRAVVRPLTRPAPPRARRSPRTVESWTP